MPIHFDDLDVLSQVEGSRSALIVPCNLCPGVTVAVREEKPFMRLFRSLLRSAPFEQYIKALRRQLEQKGVSTAVFRSTLYHNWFACMWTTGVYWHGNEPRRALYVRLFGRRPIDLATRAAAIPC